MQQHFRKDSCTQQEQGESSWYRGGETDVSCTSQSVFPPALLIPELVLAGTQGQSAVCPEPLHVLMLGTPVLFHSSP